MTNAFSVDLEEWFCCTNLATAISRNDWRTCEPRIEYATERLLTLLDRYHVRATFFILGWVAEHYPRLVQAIHGLGHEIASHGYAHTPLTHLSPVAFEADLVRSLALLKDLTGQTRFGYRAPMFTVVHRTLWAVEILQRHGVWYDSSVYPIGVHPDYGISDAPVEMYLHDNGLPEVPMSTACFGSVRVPCSGGGYFRQMPYAVSRQLIRRCRAQGRPLIFYIHPWELDTAQPRVVVPPVARWRHYRNLHTVEEKLGRLLAEFAFAPVGDVLLDHIRLCDSIDGRQS